MDNWLLSEIKRTVIGERRPTIAGRDIPYLVFRGTDATPDPLGANDREGTIYVSENVVKFDEHYADLTALHEQVECEHKLKGRAHAYAHRHAYVDELLMARQLVGQPEDVRRYVGWKIAQYPPWKVFDRQGAVAQLSAVLTSVTPRKGALLAALAAYPL